MSASKRLALVVLAVSLVFPLITTAAAACGPTCGSHATVSSGASGADTYLYRCPMHPEVTSDKPGRCPKCGMVLKEVNKADIYYQCPMDKDVVSDKPGKCPKCGMTLSLHVKPSPASGSAAGANTMWRSTMDPGEVSDHPGKDSLGMEMVPFATNRQRPCNQGAQPSK